MQGLIEGNSIELANRNDTIAKRPIVVPTDDSSKRSNWRTAKARIVKYMTGTQTGPVDSARAYKAIEMYKSEYEPMVFYTADVQEMLQELLEENAVMENGDGSYSLMSLASLEAKKVAEVMPLVNALRTNWKATRAKKAELEILRAEFLKLARTENPLVTKLLNQTEEDKQIRQEVHLKRKFIYKRELPN